jgi:hypothetical protein
VRQPGRPPASAICVVPPARSQQAGRIIGHRGEVPGPGARQAALLLANAIGQPYDEERRRQGADFLGPAKKQRACIREALCAGKPLQQIHVRRA